MNRIVFRPRLLYDFIFFYNMSLWQRVKREEETMFNRKVQADVKAKDTSIGETMDEATKSAKAGDATTQAGSESDSGSDTVEKQKCQ
jgi:hypothetical protein